jgi:hypothetical protein
MVYINADFYPDKFISMSVAEETKKNPSWVEPALQGLAFWLGYRKQLFRHHDLPEGALVAELSTIMYAHIGQDEILECEYPFRANWRFRFIASGYCTAQERCSAYVYRSEAG